MLTNETVIMNFLAIHRRRPYPPYFTLLSDLDIYLQIVRFSPLSSADSARNSKVPRLPFQARKYYIHLARRALSYSFNSALSRRRRTRVLFLPNFAILSMTLMLSLDLSEHSYDCPCSKVSDNKRQHDGNDSGVGTAQNVVARGGVVVWMGPCGCQVRDHSNTVPLVSFPAILKHPYAKYSNPYYCPKPELYFTCYLARVRQHDQHLAHHHETQHHPRIAHPKKGHATWNYITHGMRNELSFSSNVASVGLPLLSRLLH